MNVTRETLATRLQSGPLSVREATQICRSLLSAIEAAHARGHSLGAIALDTIVLEQGRAVLIPADTPAADAPATDLYAVATVLYECVSGRPWVPGADPESADWSGIPRRLRRVLRRALSTAPQRRWPDAAAFQRALWVPRPQDPIWPAVIVILLAAAIIAAIVFCKPLGLCWERQPAADTR
jgi:serine/threonine protein kinase